MPDQNQYSVKTVFISRVKELSIEMVVLSILAGSFATKLDIQATVISSIVIYMFLLIIAFIYTFWTRR